MGVRNEAVRLSLQDDFTSGMARAAAAAALLNRELNSLSGQSVATARVSKNISRDTDNIARAANAADRSINQLTGRLRLFADLAAMLGPGLAPIGAVAVPAITGLANSLGVAALAGGVAVMAFQGVGDAFKAVTKAGIEPTEANIQKARQAMEELSPAARDLVVRLEELQPAMQALRDMSAEAIMPGVLDAFDSLQSRGDEVVDVFHNISAVLGDLVSAAGTDLSSSRWDEFFDFLATDVPMTLASLGRTVGDLTHGMAELWMAFDPLNDDFSRWLEGIAEGFDNWATGLDQTEGFAEFLDYIERVGPQVAETFGALADATLEIAEAAAPLGGPVLQALESVLKVMAAIADSDLGTPIFTAVAALSLFNRTMAVAEGAMGRFGKGGTMAAGFSKIEAGSERARSSISGLARDVGVIGTTYMTAGARSERAAARMAASTERVRAAAVSAGKVGGSIAAIGFAASGAAEDIGMMNTATIGLLGSLSGLKNGGLIGAAAGGILDISNALSVGADDMERFFRITSAESGGNIAAEIAAITDEIERQQKIMDDSAGLELGITKLWSSDAAAEAEERVGFLNDRLEELKLRQEEQEIAAGLAGGSLDMEAQAAADAAREFRNLTNAMTAATEARIANKNSILGWEQAMLDGRQAGREYNQVLSRSGDLLKGQRQAGIQAKQTLLDMATAWNQQSQAIRRQTSNQREAVGALVRTATQMGMSEEAARRLARSILDIPPKRDTTYRFNGKDAGIASANAVENAIKAIPASKTTVLTVINRTINETINRGSSVGDRIGSMLGGANADGGIYKDGVRQFADGGWGSNGTYYPRVPQIVKGGANILWGEQETGEEAYISRKRGMEERNIAILNEAASWFGLGLRRYANGGISTPTTSTIDSSRSIVVNTGPVYTTDHRAMAREVEQRMSDAVALMGV